MKTTGGQTSLVYTGDTSDSFLAFITSVDPGTESVGDMDASVLATTGFKEMQPEDLADAGKLTVTGFVDTSGGNPQVGSSGDITITLPQKPGEATPATIAGPVYLSSWQLGKLEQNQWYQFTATFTWKTGKTVTKSTAA